MREFVSVSAPLFAHRAPSPPTRVTLRYPSRFPAPPVRRCHPRRAQPCLAASGDSGADGGLRQATIDLQPRNSCHLQIDGFELLDDYWLGSTPTDVSLPGYYFSRRQQVKVKGLRT